MFVFVFLLVRLTGKREVGQLGATEFVAILLVSNAVQNAMNGGDNSIFGGLILAGVVMGLSYAGSTLAFRSKQARSILEGESTLLIHKGKIQRRGMNHERLSDADLQRMLREAGTELHFVKEAILETDGHLSLTKLEPIQHASDGI